ncbi:TrbI/VirB10 family protein [Calothrix sp. PCC 6303]|uniref:TrbI/VirB10 family protein n=1 Tax=Calothrix sp. PCC 6303 TaxID=1170562 RepID=UPI0002A0148E|nr:TrbI/VirB10 family protein [Calothrix sp. PCC 6303]AFZ02062.1 hypothetical protein Cal6303_3117 [Calothrix sp. PCC 6303]
MYESSISPRNPLNFIKSSELDAPDWESRMAKLVGLEENQPTNNSVIIPEEQLEESTSSDSFSQPQQLQTKQSLSENPFAKLALVSAATLTMMLVAGVFLSQLMGLGNKKTNNNNALSPSQPQATPSTRPQNLASEIETLKTKLALTEQAETLKAAQQKLRNPQVNPTQSTLVADSQASPRNNINRVRVPNQRQPIQTAYIPNSVNIIRDLPQQSVSDTPKPQTTVESRLSPPLSSSQTSIPATAPIAQITPQATPDPLQEWMKLSKLGSYGQVAVSDNRSVNPTNSTPVNNPETATQPTNNPPNQTPPPETPTSAVSQNQSQGSKYVAVGTSVKGVLATAIFGETTRSGNKDKDDADSTVFVVRLKQPLKSIDNAIALPAKTELLAEVRSISEQGLVQLNVTKIILQNDNNPIEKSLPPNSMILRASKGRPLIANQYPNRGGSIAWMDAGLFVLGGLGKAAELYNRADSQISPAPNVIGGTIITNSNPKRNVLAGVLEGGMNTVVPQIAQRNQQAISQLSQKSNIWFLPAGKEVEIYINQSMQF